MMSRLAALRVPLLVVAALFVARVRSGAQTVALTPQLRFSHLIQLFPTEVRDAEAEGAKYPRPSTTGSATARHCVDASNHTVAKSGDFTAGPFDIYPSVWQQGLGKLWWRPARPRVSDTLVVRATSLNDRMLIRSYRLTALAHSIPSNGEEFYPSGIHLPRAGAWLIVTSVGTNWGCFLFAF